MSDRSEDLETTLQAVRDSFAGIAPYRWKVEPYGYRSWQVSITCGWVNLPEFIVYGSRERAVRRAQRRVARLREEAERHIALTVEGGEDV